MFNVMEVLALYSVLIIANTKIYPDDKGFDGI